MTADKQGRPPRVALALLAGVLPCLLLSVGVARFILHHFFVGAPYLLDSGWYSAIVYHAGALPRNPHGACNYAYWYYGIHFSPFVSAFSILSYLTPLGRIAWYAVVEGLVYAPIGIATYAVAARIDPDGIRRRLPFTILAAFAFTFTGLVWSFIDYPHYEAAIPGLICLLLGAIVTGRTRLAWLCFALATSVREDAGLHTALALTALLYLKQRGVDMAPSRRRLLTMIGVAFGVSVVGFASQKLFFGSANLLRAEYLGTPIYGHITLDSLVTRVGIFLQSCQVIYYPFLATCLVAAIRRDARYLLGWAVMTPWFLVNLTAFQDAKSRFDAYTSFPFVVSIFWVFLYGATLAPAARRMRRGSLEVLFAGVCATSLIAYARPNRQHLTAMIGDMVKPYPLHRSIVNGFVTALTEHRDHFGRLYVDHAVAALTVESLRLDDEWAAGVGAMDALAFHRSTINNHEELMASMFANQLDVCTTLPPTALRVCTRAPLPDDTFPGLTTQVVPSIFAFAVLMPPAVRIGPQGIVLRDRVVVAESLGKLPVGEYELTVGVDPRSPSTGGGVNPPTLEVLSDNRRLAFATAEPGSQELALRFEVSDTTPPRFILDTHDSTLTIRRAMVRASPRRNGAAR